MPSLKQLLHELRALDVDPDEVRIPGQLYDSLIDQAEDVADEAENPTDSAEDD